MTDGTKLITLKAWQMWMGILIIIAQFIVYGSFFLQDRNEVINTVALNALGISRNTEEIKALKSDNNTIKSIEFNLKKYLTDQGYKYIELQ